jgi:hypothetical protein
MGTDAALRLSFMQTPTLSEWFNGEIDIAKSRIEVNGATWWQWRQTRSQYNKSVWKWNGVHTPKIQTKADIRLSCFKEYNALGQVVNQEITLPESLVPVPENAAQPRHNVYADGGADIFLLPDTQKPHKGSVFLGTLNVDLQDHRRKILGLLENNPVQLLHNNNTPDEIDMLRLSHAIAPNPDLRLEMGNILPLIAPADGWMSVQFTAVAVAGTTITINGNRQVPIGYAFALGWCPIFHVQKGDHIVPSQAITASFFMPYKGGR